MKSGYLLILNIACFFNGIIMPAECSSFEHSSNVPPLIDLCLQTIAYRYDLQVYDSTGTFHPKASAEKLAQILPQHIAFDPIIKSKKRLRNAFRMLQKRNREICKYITYQGSQAVWTPTAVFKDFAPTYIYDIVEMFALEVPKITRAIETNNITQDDCLFLLFNKEHDNDFPSRDKNRLDRLSSLQSTIDIHFHLLIHSTQSKHLKSTYLKHQNNLRLLVDNSRSLTQQHMEDLIKYRNTIQEICTAYNIAERLKQLRAEENPVQQENITFAQPDLEADAPDMQEDPEVHIDELANANCCIRMLYRFNQYLHDIF